MIKKVLALGLALVFAGGAVACGGSGNPSGSQDSSKSHKTENSGENGSEPGAKGDNTIVIYQNSGVVQASGKPGSYKEDLDTIHDMILDQSGIDVQFIVPAAGGDANDKLNAMLATQQQIDLFWGSRYTFADVIQPLNDAYEAHGSHIKELWPDEAFTGLTDKEGKIWGTPRGFPTAPYPLHLRTDWLKAVGMEYPKTIDELEAVLAAFKEQDPAGNGETIPLATDLTGINNALSAGFTGVGYGRFLDEADGKLKPTVLHPGYKDFVAKVADWYDKGYIFAESFTTDRNRYNELITLGNIGGFAYWYSLVSIISPQLTAMNPEAVYEYHRPITGPAGPIETHGSVGASGGLVPAYSKNADAVVRYVDWICEKPENFLLTWKGLEDKHWAYVDKDKNVIKTLDNDSYIGEYIGSLGTPLETLYSFDDNTQALHDSWLRDKLFQFDGTVGQEGWDVAFNDQEISEKVPEKGDIQRMIDEEVVKFMTNVRSMDEWDSFIEDLHKLGIDKLSDVMTEQYKTLK